MTLWRQISFSSLSVERHKTAKKPRLNLPRPPLASPASKKSAHQGRLVMKHMGWAFPALLLSVSVAGAAPADPLAAAAESYRPVMVKEIERSLDGARELRQRIEAKDLPGAETSWISARIGWERSEVF